MKIFCGSLVNLFLGSFVMIFGKQCDEDICGADL